MQLDGVNYRRRWSSVTVRIWREEGQRGMNGRIVWSGIAVELAARRGGTRAVLEEGKAETTESHETRSQCWDEVLTRDDN